MLTAEPPSEAGGPKETVASPSAATAVTPWGGPGGVGGAGTTTDVVATADGPPFLLMVSPVYTTAVEVPAVLVSVTDAAYVPGEP
jgi:hypothetical protein